MPLSWSRPIAPQVPAGWRSPTAITGSGTCSCTVALNLSCMPAMPTPPSWLRSLAGVGEGLRAHLLRGRAAPLRNRHGRERVTEELRRVEVRHHPELVGGDVAPELLD